MSKTLYICVDAQKDFMDETGSLFVKGCEDFKLRQNMANLVKKGQTKPNLLVCTVDYHEKSDDELSDTPDYITTFPSHCMRNTSGASYISEISDLMEDSLPLVINKIKFFSDSIIRESIELFSMKGESISLIKNKFSVFEGNENAEYVFNILKKDFDKVVVFGVTTQVCVYHVAMGLKGMGFDVTIAKNAVKELETIPLEPILEEFKEVGIKWENVK